MEYLTDLKQIRVSFEAFFKAHKEVHTYKYGDIKEFTAKTDKEYIAVNIEYVNSVPGARIDRNIFNVAVMDRMSLDSPDTEHDAVARCKQIVYDLAGMVSLSNTYVLSSVQPFREDDPDITAGVVASLTVNTPMQINECSTPLNNG